ncbi:diguanylate cyclase [Shewanella corallii]|uniref:diguanylate cyclase n=1 Tax=Shewanella corallii TaxID=560080 RepID=A0ABT0N795_9GAMM|nr:diguanylate cyclase [Shewanella corallii]MCL2914294.1 diguanylate cyclase [Shewanella corallii]
MQNIKFNSILLQLSLLFGLIGYLINLYPIPLFANVELIVGNVCLVIVAAIAGPYYALLTALMCATGLYVSWDSLYPFLIFMMEALWLGLAVRRGYYLFYSAIAFWFLISPALFMLYASLYTELNEEHILFIVIKQAINGMLYASVACLLVMLIRPLSKLALKQNTHKRSFKQQLNYLFALLITSAMLISSLLYNHTYLSDQQVMVQNNLQDSMGSMSKAAERYLKTHQQAIRNAARWLSLANTDKDHWQSMLTRLNQTYPNFLTMLIADHKGNILHASPASMLADKPVHKLNVSDRDYFREALYNQNDYISDVFLGRGFGNDVIVAMSSPVYLNENYQRPQAIIEGSLDLSGFAQIEHGAMQRESMSIVLTDAKGNIIYASDNLGLPALSTFLFSRSGSYYSMSMPMMNLKNTASEVPEYLYSQQELSNQWQLYLLKPFVPMVTMAQRQYLTSVAMLALSLLVTLGLSSLLAKTQTRPLELIAQQFKYSDKDRARPEWNEEQISTEVEQLYDQLKLSQQELIRQQLQLEEQVALRTFELEKANGELQKLAERDSLTSLYNRRYAENQFKQAQTLCQRGEQAMAVVLLDLDHFKMVNDEFGHLGGDASLKTVAGLLSNHFVRETDIVSRYGGEEFLLILPMCNPLKVEAHLKDFTAKLRNTKITNPEDGRLFSLSVSIGAVIANAGYSSRIDTWIKRADDNLYRAKSAGRDKVIATIIEDI